MAGIEFKGLNAEFTTRPLSTGKRIDAPALEKAAFDSRVAWRYDNAERRGRYQRLGNVVLDALDRKIANLETAAANFDWPVSGSTAFGARLVTPSNADAALAGKLSTDIRAGDDVQRYYKFFSRGRPGHRETDLGGSTYSFTVTHGGTSQELSVTLADGADWGEVLTATASAVNASSLPVQAEVIEQTGSYQDLPFLPRTGEFLVITVDPAYADQDVSMADTEGHLLLNLELDETSVPVTPATQKRHHVSRFSRADASAYTSAQLNPVADHGLTAGVHKLAFTVAGVTDTVSVSVTDDMDNEDLLIRAANAINSTSSALSATVREGTMSSGELDPTDQRSVYLEVTLAAPKRGERLRLAEYGGPWLDDVDGFHDPSSGLPNWVTGGERYIATTTANGWTANNVYEYDGSAWTETAVVADNAAYSANDGADYFFDGTDWSATASGTLLDTLGLTATAHPGADATATIDGRERTSETGVFALDQGRVTATVEAVSGAGAPFSVVEAFDEVRERFSDVVYAYNDLRTYILSNNDLFEAGFADTWAEPVGDLGTELDWMGASTTPDTATLWVDNDAFWSALGQDPDRAKAALYDAPDGLVPRLAAVSADNRTPSLEDRLIEPTLVADVGPSVARETALRERSTLQQVIDAATDTPAPAKDPYLENSGLLDRIIDAKREALAALASPDGGSIFKTST